MTNIIILIALLVSTALTVFLINLFVQFKLKNKLSGIENPISKPIFKGVLFISSGILLSELISTFQTLTKILPNQIEGNNLILQEISFYSIFLALVLIVFAVVFWLSTLIFTLINKGENVFVEVANNNLHALIMFCAVLLTLTFAVKTAITPMLDQLIPYPSMPIFR